MTNPESTWFFHGFLVLFVLLSPVQAEKRENCCVEVALCWTIGKGAHTHREETGCLDNSYYFLVLVFILVFVLLLVFILVFVLVLVLVKNISISIYS